MELSKIPHILGLNRMLRAYTGGKLLDEWQRLENPSDGNMSEEFLISTVEIPNEDPTVQEGVSKTILPNGESKALTSLIAEDYEAFLGSVYADKKDVCVSARVGDTTVRHVLQCHPDTEFAQTYLNFPNGKAEAWYIQNTRSINGSTPCLYAGFKPGVTKELWKELFEKQDIPAMLDCMHNIPVQQGHVYFVDAGMPHCLGAGSVFLEIHEPCDYTFRVEKDYLPNRIFSDFEMHFGLGNDKMLDAFHYDTYTEEEILKKCVLDPTAMFEQENGKAEEVVSYEQAKRFKVEKYTFTGTIKVPDFDGHRIAITVQGKCKYGTGDYTCESEQGRGCFLPYGVKDLTLESVEGETIVLVCYPPIY